MNRIILAAFGLAFPFAANAIELDWSGFGTVGYAQSDKAYRYQRWIDNDGTLSRDSVIGGQLDLRFNQQWGAAIQGKIAPSDRHDSAVAATLSWAFVSWRPVDDVLIRLGKLRVPMMLNTENHDVGVTYDFVRLPIEVYSMIPTTDFTGLSASKSWLSSELEWTVEVYSGKAKSDARFYGREMTPTTSTPGSFFLETDVDSTGVVASLRSADNLFRVGIHEARVYRDGGLASGIPYVSAGGYYDINSAPRKNGLRIPVQSVGMSLLLPGDVRLTSEVAHMHFSGASSGLSRWGGYLAVSRRFGGWTPYLLFAKTRSSSSSLKLYREIEANADSVPLFLRNYQKFNADAVTPYDQWTAAIGASYRVTTRSLLKLEWAQTHTGTVSNFIDAPSGGDSEGKRLNVFSLSYSFSF
jgi:opacity protein-like surface antigen